MYQYNQLLEWDWIELNNFESEEHGWPWVQENYFVSILNGNSALCCLVATCLLCHSEVMRTVLCCVYCAVTGRHRLTMLTKAILLSWLKIKCCLFMCDNIPRNVSPLFIASYKKSTSSIQKTWMWGSHVARAFADAQLVEISLRCQILLWHHKGPLYWLETLLDKQRRISLLSLHEFTDTHCLTH